MASATPSSFILIIIVIVSALIHETTSDPRAGSLGLECGLGHVSDISAYMGSYSKALKSVEMDLRKYKFSAREEGEPPNRVYVLAQCVDDLSVDACASCFSEIVTELSSCYPNPSGRVYLDGCFMRFDNYSFFRETTSNSDTMRCSESTEISDDYKNMVRLVVNETVKNAANNNGYSYSRATSYGMPIFTMASCWKTLDKNSCTSCLRHTAMAIVGCLPALEGRMLSAGCFLRYSDYDFSNIDPSPEDKAIIIAYLAFVFGAVGLCLLAIVIGFFVGKMIYKKLNSLNYNAEGIEMGAIVGKRTFMFKYSTLQKATEDFSEANKIGRGGYGEVFKGTLADGREIAIKRLFVSGRFRCQEVGNEMDIICQAQHKNLVRFLGCCFTAEESFLVYEFLANSSLDLILFDSEKKKELDWKRRLGVLVGTAEGLEYLHKDCQVRIIHRDIKASNILLDLKYRPKIADFGLARFSSGDRAAPNTVIAGTLGYMAPEYLAQGRLTEKADVYSYGVLLLEIVSGKQSNTFQSEESFSTLVTTTWKHFQSDTVSEIIDKSMEIEDVEKEVLRAVQIGLLCTQELPSLRPTMTSVVHMLRHKDLPLPTPTKPPFTDECLTLSGSLGSSRAHSLGSFHRHSFSVDSCKYFDADNDRR